MLIILHPVWKCDTLLRQFLFHSASRNPPVSSCEGPDGVEADRPAGTLYIYTKAPGTHSSSDLCVSKKNEQHMFFLWCVCKRTLKKSIRLSSESNLGSCELMNWPLGLHAERTWQDSEKQIIKTRYIINNSRRFCCGISLILTHFGQSVQNDLDSHL